MIENAVNSLQENQLLTQDALRKSTIIIGIVRFFTKPSVAG